MHPAYSVIIFTTASGAGCGLLALIGAMAVLGGLDGAGGFGATGTALALVLIGGGLLSSAQHLGRPERMLLALTQWRSSWLSREGIVALATFVPAGILFLACAFGWDGGIVAIAGALAALLALATIGCTAMIYASLKPIRQWRSPLVLPSYFLLALMTGSLLLMLLARAFGDERPGFGWLALAATVAALVVKLCYWRFVDDAPATSDLGTATGLGRFGKVTLLDPPHTEENFVMREMGYQVARSHAFRLRRISMILLFAAPIVLTFLGGIIPPGLAVIAAAIGVLVERWLFFAEASHTSVLYYGKSA
jgi:sulfite dehydrogenase (quinone) subunit SoeC